MGERSKTLYVTDLDGTLLNNESVISEFSRRCLNELTRMGAFVSFATARTPATVVNIFQGVELAIPGIVMTGAATYDLNTGVYGDTHFLNKEVVEAVLDVYESAGIRPFTYCWRPDNLLHAFHAEKMDGYEKGFYEIRRDMCLKHFHLDEQPQTADLKHVFLIFAVGLRDVFMPLLPKLEKAAGYGISYYNDIFNPECGFIEVFAHGVNKARAIEKLKEQYNFDRVVAFGDNLNDLAMFDVADVGVAVENAFEPVKDKADIVIGPNTSDSVVKFILDDFRKRQ